MAKAKSVPVLLNPAPAPAQGLPGEDFEGLEHLVCNETEAEMLSHMEMGVSLSESASSSKLESEDASGGKKKGLENVFQHFHELGVRNVIITMGAEGVYYSQRDNYMKEGAGG